MGKSALEADTFGIRSLNLNASSFHEFLSMKNTSPLAMALRFGSGGEVREILSEGVDPNRSGDFHVSKEGFEQKIETLLEHG